MKETKGTLQTPDGVTLHTISWMPEGTPRAHIVLIHGLGEHSGRYAHVGAYMAERGFAVFSYDQRGHGKSSGATVTGYFDSLATVSDDVIRFLDSLPANPSGKTFLYGHSLGTLVSLGCLLKNQNRFNGAILTGTPLEVESSQPKALIIAAQLLNNLLPKFAVTPPLPVEVLSTDEAVGKAYAADPLVFHGKVSVRMGYHVVFGSREIKARMSTLQLPMLILHGEADQLCPPAGSKTLHAGAGSKDKTLKTYAGMRHEIHNERDKAQVLGDMAAWLDKHV